MHNVTVQSRQSWTDLAIQGYGNVDATVELLANNVQDVVVDMSQPVMLAAVTVDENSAYQNPKVLKAIAGKVIATMDANDEYDEEYDDDEYD